MPNKRLQSLHLTGAVFLSRARTCFGLNIVILFVEGITHQTVLFLDVTSSDVDYDFMPIGQTTTKTTNKLPVSRDTYYSELIRSGIVIIGGGSVAMCETMHSKVKISDN